MQEALAEVRRSHTEGNVPPPAQFARLLKRDLSTYFKLSTGRAVSVEYEMLRQAPTQSGLSFPKYYVWARVFEHKKLLTEGAVRVAAVDKSRFDVTDFLSRASLRQNPSRIAEVFPSALVPAIQARLR